MAAVTQTRPAPATLRTPLFILGVGLALLAFLLMFALGIVFVNRSQPTSTVRVIAAGTDIGAREPITPDMLTFVSLPSTAAPPHAFAQLSQLTGFSALVPIYKGEVVTTNVVAATPDALLAGATSSYLPIPQGDVAMTIPTGEQQGVAGYIAQGDYIDMIATINTATISPVNPRQVTRTVFTNVKVIRVGPPSAAPKQGQGQGVASSLTVVMSLCDAQYLEWLMINATLKYVLLAYPDYAKSTTGDPSCPSTAAPGLIGPAEVQQRWDFTKG